MTQTNVNQMLRLTAGILGCWLGLVASAWSAEMQMQKQAAPSAQSGVSPTGKLLTIEDAVRIGLDNHPRIRSASERIGSQQAILGQQMSAYYPTISSSNFYRTGTSGSTGVVNTTANDAFNSQLTFNMTLYNFGKREGNVQAARETLEASKEDYETTNAIKKANKFWRDWAAM